ncbi:Meiotic expression up-regulated protein 26 [Tolypocladium ophioglossoides CBS 100239]|uniref:Meiotic expression up-regulated protein 26 n=1 Tax=Tolypocladium ophioglossoides (strain CBS 100239) TaxID=1163406 RepID=A0A0L0N1Z0_TOLOC|nr:Meiotic expression up-regulated protein 26 [Tolypocladium ophioglossoides CBS 100239]
MESSQVGLYASVPESVSCHDPAHTACGRRHQLQPHHLYYNTDDELQSPSPHQAYPVPMMDRSRVPTTEGMMSANAAWMTPPTSQPRRRPATIYQGMPCYVGDECAAMPSWDSLSLQPGPNDATSRPVSMHQELLPLGMANNGHWTQKTCEESLDFQGLDVGGLIGQACTTDEAVPIIDLRFSNPAQDGQSLNLDGSLNRRRMSGSSLTTSGAMSDLPSYDDFSAALSEAPSYGSDYPATSNRNSLMSSIHMSPVPSPCMTPHSRPEKVRAHSRGRASPSPRPSVRSVPYSIEGSKNQRWSTGSYAPSQSRRHSPFVYNSTPDIYGMPQRMSYQGPPPTAFATQPQTLSIGNFQGGPRAPYMMAGQSIYPRNSMLLPSQPFQSDARHFEQPPPLLSQGLFKMLQSNGDPHTLHGHYTDLSDPPDLFASLQEEQIPPSEEDMNPSDPDMTPYEQDLRCEGDLYTPRWVRGHGNKREGWCGICKPGRWLVLKNSAFWYDKSFTHGISAATGSPFQEPLDTRRMDGNPDVWEGLCGSCNDWIALVSSKKKGTTWFRHAYKCHTHSKIKDVPKRRRETFQGRALAAQISKNKQDTQGPETPQSGITTTSSLNTPTLVPMAQVHAKSRREHQVTPVPTPEPLRLPSARPPTSLPRSASGLGNMI